MRINRASREISLKVVYYGPGLGGKTTNLVRLHARYAAEQRGELIKLDTETERTLFFDYFPLAFGAIAGHRVKIDFFTVPGQSFYQATRQAVLEGVDGIVFVADSHPDREEANLVSREDLARSLETRGRSLGAVPHVYQWNKRDVRKPIPVSILGRLLNPEGAPALEAVATTGVGVWETQAEIVKLVLQGLRGAPRPTAMGAERV
ncbi:MAG: GTPase domain-containing protein [Pseudomonadota bacterium]|nr:GTPase domain-containing protein [Pseudomonadota bacterium]